MSIPTKETIVKGILADAKTGLVVEIDDLLPHPDEPPEVFPEGLDLSQAAATLADLEKRLKAIEASK